ncbi:haspin [Calliopsis andreniformis]|uniref:haspin n=1 Tax=Calliopsis andreniformis TaxID=337506 RepID=UPI003FCE8708
MTMHHKLPIRTYERKRCKQVVIPLEKLHISEINNVCNANCISLKGDSSTTEIKEVNDDSCRDPFDTTFDRLAKKAKAKIQALKTCNKVSTNANNSSDYDSSTSIVVDHKNDSFHDFKLPNISIKSVEKKKRIRKKPIMKVVKKTVNKIDKRQRKVKKNTSLNKYESSKSRNKKKTVFANSKSDSLHISNIENDHNVNNKAPKNYPNKQYILENDINQCSVLLDGYSLLEWRKKMYNGKNNSLKETQRDISENYKTLKCTETIESNIDSLKYNNLNVKHCFVRIEQLKITSESKPFMFGKKCTNVISSTPIGKPLKSVRHLISETSLSPIRITYPEQSNGLALHIDNNSVTISNSRDINPLKCKQVKIDLGERCDLLKDSIRKEEISVSLICLENSNCSKYSLNKLEDSDKRNSVLLNVHDCSLNNINKEQGELTEISSKKHLESTKNTLVTEIKKDDVKDNVSLVSTQKHPVLDTVEKRPYLNFSVDVNRSHSLFQDTDESNSSLYQGNATKRTKRSSIINITNKESDNETCSNSVELNKSSPNINNNKVEISEMTPLKLTILDTSSSDTKLKTEEVDFKISVSNDILLRTNNSFINNDNNCNMIEPSVVLNQLQDPVRITRKRKQYCKWELDLISISEDHIESKKDQVYSETTSKSIKTKLPRKTLQPLETITENPINNRSNKIENVLYLKPGKSWARSLSILNNLKYESNLERLSVGKGRKWRFSVQDILNMQKQGVIQSCVRKNEELEENNEIIGKTQQELANKKSRTCDSTSLGRLSRRISVRVVPIHKTIKSVEDAPFLEVYGIIPVKGKRVSLICNRQKSSLCNIQNDDTSGHVIEEHIVSPAKEVILERCFQKDYIPFSIHFSDSYLEHCRKIGEGVYGEVFLYEHENKKSVIKIIPIEGSELVNGEPQKKFHEILSEIVIAKELHNLRFNTKYNTDGFVEVKNIKCIKGKYPEKLVELWNIYDEEKRSDNDCPSMFNDDQLFIVLELGHGGKDLEAFVFQTAEEAYVLFIQAALALAVAEKAVEFEHRDLHWGNILISRTNESHIYYKLGTKKIALLSKGVKVSIIDFTLSRVTYQGCSVFNDLASDPALFTAQGEYQFEIYRLMRDKIKNNWERFEPYTNILWLHYTLDKMITAVRYRRKNLKIHKNGLLKLEELKSEILTYSSAFNFVTNCDKIDSLLCTNMQPELA